MNKKMRNKLKSRRISGGLPIDHANVMAWMKILRDWNKTRKVYEINPYVEVYQFRENIFGLFTENCDAAGDVWMYLIVGPQKAMLIDTGFGLGDLEGLVNLLAEGKPLVVVNTHPHPDHSFGNCRFNEIYCHKFAAEGLEGQNQTIWDYLFDENGQNIWLDFDRNDLPVFKKYQIKTVEDGHIFNLGEDYDIELKWVPGHQSGHSMFIDKKERILFAGDGLCSHISGEGSGAKPGDSYSKYNNVETYYEELSKLAARTEEFDSIFPSHFIVEIPTCVLEATLKACKTILDDETAFDYSEDYLAGNGSIIPRKYKFIWGFGVLGYNEGGLYKPKES